MCFNADSLRTRARDFLMTLNDSAGACIVSGERKCQLMLLLRCNKKDIERATGSKLPLFNTDTFVVIKYDKRTASQNAIAYIFIACFSPNVFSKRWKCSLNQIPILNYLHSYVKSCFVAKGYSVSTNLGKVDCSVFTECASQYVN